MKRCLRIWMIGLVLLLPLASASQMRVGAGVSQTAKILSATVPMRALRNVAIRTGAGQGHAIIGIARKGEILRSTVDDGNWTIVRYKGKDAYVLKDYLEELSDSVLTKDFVRANVNNIVLNGPSIYAKTLGMAKRDQLFSIRNEYADWYEINFYGAKGIVSKLYFDNLGDDNSGKKQTQQSETPQDNTQQPGDTPAAVTDVYVPVEGTQYVEATALAYVRSGPSDDKNDLGVIYDGSIVPKLGTIGQWVCIEYNHRIGYVHSKYVKDSDYSLDKAVTEDQYAIAANKLITLMNENRVDNGVAALEVSKVLMDAAKVRVEEITKVYSHTRPDGSMCNSIAPNDIFGENIARGTALPTPEAAAKGFMSSDAHKTNAMDIRHTKTGAACINVNGELFWVQLFVK